MKLIDAIKLSNAEKQNESPFNVPDCGRDELPEFFCEMGYVVGAEIGVYRGEFTEKFCKAGLQIYAIDPWLPFVGQGKSEQRQDMQDYNYDQAKKILSQYKNCTMVREYSMDALKHFEPKSLDFVYIDGDHRFRYIAEDISEWYAKVKNGGVIAGHDYYATTPSANNLICQVKPVVDAFIQTYGITNFYTFGRSDRFLSWMFIKP